MKSNYLTKLQEQYPTITDKFIKSGGLHCSVEEAEVVAQSLAKEVVEEINKEWAGYESIPTEYAIELIKAKFQL